MPKQVELQTLRQKDEGGNSLDLCVLAALAVQPPLKKKLNRSSRLLSGTTRNLFRMLSDFLNTNRAELAARCRQKVAGRTVQGGSGRELDYGITVFLDQLIQTLEMEQSSEPKRSRQISGPADGRHAASAMGETTAHHGRELLRHGFTVDEVVHDYGDLCQAITDLAFEQSAPIETDEFRTLNRCLDNAIATAVTEFGYHRDSAVAGQQQHELNERLGSFAHELRNHLSTATLALAVIKSGNVGLSGATGAVLDRSLVGLRNLIDHSLAEVRMSAGISLEHSVFSLATFIAEVKLSASLGRLSATAR